MAPGGDRDQRGLAPRRAGARPGGPAGGRVRRPAGPGRAAVFTEVNPSYDPSGASLSRYVDTVAGVLAAGLSQGG